MLNKGDNPAKQQRPFHPAASLVVKRRSVLKSVQLGLTLAIVLVFELIHPTLVEHAAPLAAQNNKHLPGPIDTNKDSSRPASMIPAVKNRSSDSSIFQQPVKLPTQSPLAYNDNGNGDDSTDSTRTVLISAAHAKRGPRIDGQIQAVAIGDVDGDDLPETVIAGLSRLWIYKFIKDRFVEMAALKGFGNYIGVDTSDVNGNGRDEIFVTNFDNGNGRVGSFVLEYDGRKSVAGCFFASAKLRRPFFNRESMKLYGETESIAEVHA